MNSTQNDKLVYADEWNVSSQYFYKNEYYSWMADNLTGHKKVLEIGCGSGRDSRYFLSRGYDVVPVDGSMELCLLAGNYIGMDVRNITYEELDYNNEFDAVWSCASFNFI